MIEFTLAENGRPKIFIDPQKVEAVVESDSANELIAEVFLSAATPVLVEDKDRTAAKKIAEAKANLMRFFTSNTQTYVRTGKR